MIQSNAFTKSQISTVVVAVITSNLALENAPRNVHMSKSESGLGKPSVVNISQIINIDKSLLTEKVRALPGGVLGRVEDGLRLILCI